MGSSDSKFSSSRERKKLIVNSSGKGAEWTGHITVMRFTSTHKLMDFPNLGPVHPNDEDGCEVFRLMLTSEKIKKISIYKRPLKNKLIATIVLCVVTAALSIAWIVCFAVCCALTLECPAFLPLLIAQVVIPWVGMASRILLGLTCFLYHHFILLEVRRTFKIIIT